jgi:hypothetical protein
LLLLRSAEKPFRIGSASDKNLDDYGVSRQSWIAIPSHLGVDSIVIGLYRGEDLYYAARARPRGK